MEIIMKVQVLVASMHQADHSLIDKMNIKSDVIVGNQTDFCSDEEFEVGKYTAKYYNRRDRGVGLNRNVALSHCHDDIVTFADDDMIFIDGYAEKIVKAFEELPDADCIIFNIRSIGSDNQIRQIKHIKRVRLYNVLHYGAARLSVKAKSLKRENICFHLCFGGGTRYGSGEDTLFLVDLLKHKLKIYTYPLCIAQLDQSSSTWFTGYDDKFLHDKGALYAAISKHFARLLCLQDLIRHKYIYPNKTFVQAYQMMKKGAEDYLGLNEYK